MDSIDQLPFANDNAGTIKQRVNQYNNQMNHSNPVVLDNTEEQTQLTSTTTATSSSESSNNTNDSIQLEHNESAADPNNSNILNDIGNMLANLTDELDAMLEEEKRVGLNDSE